MSETYTPPQPAFFRCRCGQLVLKVKKGVYVTPALGLPHQCQVKKQAA